MKVNVVIAVAAFATPFALCAVLPPVLVKVALGAAFVVAVGTGLAQGLRWHARSTQ